MLKIMQQAQQMQSRLQEIQDELQRATVVGTAGGGMVTVEADGKGTVRKVRIDPSVVSPSDVEMLEDLIAVAVGDAQGWRAGAGRGAEGGGRHPAPVQAPALTGRRAPTCRPSTTWSRSCPD